MIPSDCSRLRSRRSFRYTQDRPTGSGGSRLARAKSDYGVERDYEFFERHHHPRAAPRGSGIFPERAQSAIHPSASHRYARVTVRSAPRTRALLIRAIRWKRLAQRVSVNVAPVLHDS